MLVMDGYLPKQQSRTIRRGETHPLSYLDIFVMCCTGENIGVIQAVRLIYQRLATSSTSHTHLHTELPLSTKGRYVLDN